MSGLLLMFSCWTSSVLNRLVSRNSKNPHVCHIGTDLSNFYCRETVTFCNQYCSLLGRHDSVCNNWGMSRENTFSLLSNP